MSCKICLNISLNYDQHSSICTIYIIKAGIFKSLNSHKSIICKKEFKTEVILPSFSHVLSIFLKNLSQKNKILQKDKNTVFDIFCENVFPCLMSPNICPTKTKVEQIFNI